MGTRDTDRWQKHLRYLSVSQVPNLRKSYLTPLRLTLDLSQILFGQNFTKVAIVCVQCIALYRAPVWLYILEDALVVALSLFFALLSFPVS